MKAKKLLMAAVIAVCGGAFADDSRTPIAEFAKLEEFSDAALSPDGRYLAFISTVDGRRVALVRDLKGDDKLTPVMNNETTGDYDLKWCRFANAMRLVCGLSGTTQMQVRSRSILIPSSALIAVDADGKQFVELMNAASRRHSQLGPRGMQRTADPNQIVVQAGSNARTIDVPRHFYTVDINAGKTTQIMTAMRNRDLWSLYGDGAGKFLLADNYGSHPTDYYSDSSGNSRYLVRQPSKTQRLFALRGDEWLELKNAGAMAEKVPFADFLVDSARGIAYGHAVSDGRMALWEFDLQDQRAPSVVFSHPRVDVGAIATDSLGKAIGVYYDTDRPRVRYIDPALSAIVAGVDKSFPDSFNSIHSLSDDRKTAVIASRSEVDAGSYFLYDATNRKLTKIGSANGNLPAAKLARTRAVEYPHDGVSIPAYLTAPAGASGSVPLVVLPPSGKRASWQYQMLTQFFASRGYAVLTPNYRGVSGYGAQWRANAGQWGGAIYADITAGARWAIAQGVADAKRVCIAGYGDAAYVALLATMRDPDLYRCAISIGGRSDFVGLLEQQERFTEFMFTAVEDLGVKVDKAVLKEESPARNAERVRSPVLLVHGGFDPAVPVAQSNDMAAALEKAGKPHKYVMIEKADDTFWRPSERQTLLAETEAFLAQHLQ